MQLQRRKVQAGERRVNNSMVPEVTFEVLLEDEVASFASNEAGLVGNESLLSLANDYEDGEWRYSRFGDFIWDSIQETALSQSERAAWIGSPMTMLRVAAERLRICDDNGKGSELAEIFLYGVMRRHYGALPAVPKIFHKQNRNDNAKGADSVHVVVSDGGAFELWLGEAKFYKSISDSDFDTFISSVENTLDKVAIRKENSIILGVRDLEECLKSRYTEDRAESIYKDIKRALAPETSVDGIRRILHIPILLIDECDITKQTTVFDEEYRNSVKEHHKERAVVYFTRQVERLKDKVHMYSEVRFHLILFPIPDKKKIVDEFLSMARRLRGGES